MKIIFLDIDGPICTIPKYREEHKWFMKHRAKKYTLNRYKIKRDTLQMNSQCVSALNKLVHETDAKIVISSAWRYNYSVKYFQKIFKSKGFVGEIIDQTPTWEKYKNLIGIKTINDLEYFWQYERGNEIKLWLDWNKNKQIESFLIIDDDVDDIFPIFPDTYIKVDINKGFRMEHIIESISILNKEAQNE